MVQVLFGAGFVNNAAAVRESGRTQTSVIGGKKIKEKKGKLSGDLGKPAMKATEGELQSYVNKAKGGAEKHKRVARVNLMKAHKKGHKAKGDSVPRPKKGKVAVEDHRSPQLQHVLLHSVPTLAVVGRRFAVATRRRGR